MLIPPGEEKEKETERREEKEKKKWFVFVNACSKPKDLISKVS